ncbi:hypothetical protein PLESTM_000248300 [Pleodorina starrii]|nr:hypothetical protein PLESTM_000248300 [Pleodorina starrii]
MPATGQRSCAGDVERQQSAPPARGAARRRSRAAAQVLRDDDDGAGGGADGGDRTPPPLPPPPRPLDKCARLRVVVCLQLAGRALRHLGRPAARLQLRQADTKAAVAELIEALGDAAEVLAARYDAELQALVNRVGCMAEDLTA